LSSGNEEKRWRAAEALSLIDEPSVYQALLDSLNDKSKVVQIKVVESISILGIQEATPDLLCLLNEDHLGLRKKIIEALGWLKDNRATEILIQILEDKNEDFEIRKRSAWALGEIGDPKAVDTLLDYIDQGNEDLAKLTSKALTKIGKHAIEKIIHAIPEKTKEFRSRAAWVLSNIKEPETAIILMKNADRVDSQHKAFSRITMKILANLGEVAVEPLISLLNNNDVNIRRRAIWGLRIIGYPAVDNLIEALKTSDVSVKRRILGILIGIGNPAVKPLINLLRNKNADNRLSAIIALGEIKDHTAVESLMKQLNDPNIDIRLETSLALGFIGDKRAIEPLVDRFFIETDLNVKRATAESLFSLGWQPSNDNQSFLFLSLLRAWGDLAEFGVKAINTLIQAFSEFYEDDFESISYSLMKINHEFTIPKLVHALINKDFRIRKGAAETLVKLGWQPRTEYETALFLIARQEWGKLAKLGLIAEEPLLKVMDDENKNIRFFACQVLKKIGWQPKKKKDKIKFLIGTQRWSEIRKYAYSATSYLIQALDDADVDIRRGVINVLGEIKDPNAIEALIQALQDEDPYVRLYAVKALENIHDPIVVDALLSAKEDPNPYVKQAAEVLLNRMPSINLSETNNKETTATKCKAENLRLKMHIIYDFIKTNPGISQEKIILDTNTSPRTVRYILKSLLEKDLIKKKPSLKDTRKATYYAK